MGVLLRRRYRKRRSTIVGGKGGRVPKIAYRKRSGYKKTSLYRAVKSIMYKNTETKYFNSAMNISFAANNSTSTGGEGYVATQLPLPSQGTSAQNRIGNSITITGIHGNVRVFLAPSANNNSAICGRIMLVKYKPGGTTFPMTQFMNQDPLTNSVSMNSLRAVEHYQDFRVVLSKRIRLTSDNYTGSTSSYSLQLGWKGKCVQKFETGSSNPTENSLFWVFVADTGAITGTGNNYIAVNGQYNMYYKDD